MQQCLIPWISQINFSQKLMTEVTPQLLEAQIDNVLKLTGEESFLNWGDFEGSSKKVMEAVESLNRQITLFRQAQQIYFISNLKKMKGADLPDMFKSVKSNKLHIKALKPILNRFKLNGETIELVDSIESLKKQASDSLNEYSKNNEEIAEHFQTLTNFIKERVGKYNINQDLLAPQKVEGAQKYESKFKFQETDVQTICSNINMLYIPGTDGLIGLKTYAQIVDASVNLSTDKFVTLTKEARTKQRALLSKPKEYLESMHEYLMSSETLVTDAQLSIAAKLGIPTTKFEETETLLMERGLGNNILALQTMARSQMKQKIKPEKSVTMDQSIEIIAHQIELLKTKGDYIQQIIGNFPKTQEAVQLIPMLLTYILNDLVFEKYQIEEEDFMANINEKSFSNPELIKLFQEMQEAILGFMQKLGILSENFKDENLMGLAQGQAAIGAGKDNKKPPAQMLPPMGLLPGADPLAYQQMQAQLQMMNKKK